jgi:hypothetical protein
MSWGHPYIALDVDRYSFVAKMAVAVVPIAVGLSTLVEGLAGSLAPYVAPPGALGFFAAAFWLYDTKLWRWRPFGIKLSSIPDLSGHWTGTVTLCEPAPGAEPHEILDCFLDIRQSWTRILIEFGSPKNVSRSVSAVVTVHHQNEIKALLQYHYYVEWEDPTLNHGGSQRLSPDRSWDKSSNINRLAGEFFTDKNFREHGELAICRSTEVTAAKPAHAMT